MKDRKCYGVERIIFVLGNSSLSHHALILKRRRRWKEVAMRLLAICYSWLWQPLSVSETLRDLQKVAQQLVAKLHHSNLCVVTFICTSFLKVPLTVKGPSREMIVDTVLVKLSAWEEKRLIAGRGREATFFYFKQWNGRFTFLSSGSTPGLKCILNAHLSNWIITTAPPYRSSLRIEFEENWAVRYSRVGLACTWAALQPAAGQLGARNPGEARREEGLWGFCCG